MSHKKNRERNDLVDIWRIVSPSEKRYSWRQKSPVIHCRLVFFFIISVGLILQEKHILVINGFKSDHSFLLLEIDKQQLKKGKGCYQLNASLLFKISINKFVFNDSTTN